MARRRYPSDDERLKIRRHVKVHLSVATHRKTAAVWADLEKRAMLVELWRLAGEAFASKTGDTVCLAPPGVQSVTGRERLGAGLARLRSLCGELGYPIRTEGRATFVTIRNFSKKQGFGSANLRSDSAETTELRLPPNSELRTPSTEEAHSSSASQTQSVPSARTRWDPGQGSGGHGSGVIRTEFERPPQSSAKRRGRKPQPPTPAPEELTPGDHARVVDYFREVSPHGVLPELEQRIESALLYHRANGIERRDWASAVINNIVSLVNRERERSNEPPLPGIKQARERNHALQKARKRELEGLRQDLERVNGSDTGDKQRERAAIEQRIAQLEAQQ